jgi:hypothetical protein
VEAFETSGTDGLGSLIDWSGGGTLTLSDRLAPSWIKLTLSEQMLLSALSLLPPQPLPQNIVNTFVDQFSDGSQEALSHCLHHRILRFDPKTAEYRFYPLFGDFAMRRIKDLSAEDRIYFTERFRRSIYDLFITSRFVMDTMREQEGKAQAEIIAGAIKVSKELSDAKIAALLPQDLLVQERSTTPIRWQTLLPEWYLGEKRWF